MAEIKIGGTEYRVEPLGAKDAYKLLTDIMLLTGSGTQYLATLLFSQEDGETENDQPMDSVEAYEACIEILREHGTQAFVDMKARVTSLAQAKRPSGVYETVDLDVDFPGDLQGAEKLFEFVMEVQFGNFSKGPKHAGPIALAMQTIQTLFRLKSSNK